MLENIKNNIKKLKGLHEGLSKKTYNKLIDSIQLGVELELKHDDIDTLDNSSFVGDIDLDGWGDYKTWRQDVDAYQTRIDDDLSELENLVSTYGYDLDRTSFDEYGVRSSASSNEISSLVEADCDEIERQSDEIIDDLGSLESHINNISDEEFMENAPSGTDEDNLQEFIDEQKDEMQRHIDNIRDSHYTLITLLGRLKRLAEMIQSDLEIESSPNTGIDDVPDLFGNRTNILLRETGDYYVGHKSTTYWIIKEDGSLGEKGVELSSPVMDYNTFIDYIPQITQSLEEDGFYSDEDCGYHISISSTSIDIKDLIKDTFKRYNKKYNKLASLMIATQQGYKSVLRYNAPDRQDYNTYAQSLLVLTSRVFASKVWSRLYRELNDGWFDNRDREDRSTMRRLHESIIEVCRNIFKLDRQAIDDILEILDKADLRNNPVFEPISNIQNYIRDIAVDAFYRDLEDPKIAMYSKKYDAVVDSILENPDKYTNLNLKNTDYVELRSLGGVKGFRVLQSEKNIKQFLYDAISQAFAGIEDVKPQDVYKLLTIHKRVPK